MNPMFIFSMVCYAIYFLSAGFTGIFLIVKGIKNRMYHVIYFSIGFFMFILSVLFGDLNPNTPTLLRSLAGSNFPIFVVFFTKETYYKRRKSNFKLVLSVSITLRIIHIIEINIFGHSVPTKVPILPGELGSYYFHVLIYVLVVSIPNLWLANSARKAYLQSKNDKNIFLWINKRNLMISISNFIYLVIIWFAFFLPLDGLAYASPSGIPVTLTLMIFVLFYSGLSLIIWVMPQFVKNWFNKGYVGIEPLDSKEVSTATPDLEVHNKLFSRSKIMSVINYGGNILAPMIQTTPSAARGLLILSVRQEFGDRGMRMLNFSDVDKILTNSLKDRLEKRGTEDVEGIIDRLRDELVKNQSLLLMLAI